MNACSRSVQPGNRAERSPLSLVSSAIDPCAPPQVALLTGLLLDFSCSSGDHSTTTTTSTHLRCVKPEARRLWRRRRQLRQSGGERRGGSGGSGGGGGGGGGGACQPGAHRRPRHLALAEGGQGAPIHSSPTHSSYSQLDTEGRQGARFHRPPSGPAPPPSGDVASPLPPPALPHPPLGPNLDLEVDALAASTACSASAASASAASASAVYASAVSASTAAASTAAAAASAAVRWCAKADEGGAGVASSPSVESRVEPAAASLLHA